MERANPDDAMRRMPRPQANLTVLEGPHGCSEGWLFDEHGRAYRCPDCHAAAEAARVEHEIRVTGVGERYWTTTWDDMDLLEPMPQIKRASERISDILDAGDHLLLSGPPSSGKTQSAVLLIRAALEAKRSARLLNLGRAGMEIRAAYKTENGPTEDQVVAQASRPDLLVIDDLGAGETGNATLEQRILYLVLEERQNTRRSTVVTTNLEPQEVAKRLGQRLLGRLQPLTILQFRHGKNFRRPGGKTAWEDPE